MRPTLGDVHRGRRPTWVRRPHSGPFIGHPAAPRGGTRARSTRPRRRGHRRGPASPTSRGNQGACRAPCPVASHFTPIGTDLAVQLIAATDRTVPGRLTVITAAAPVRHGRRAPLLYMAAPQASEAPERPRGEQVHPGSGLPNLEPPRSPSEAQGDLRGTPDPDRSASGRAGRKGPTRTSSLPQQPLSATADETSSAVTEISRPRSRSSRNLVGREMVAPSIPETTSRIPEAKASALASLPTPGTSMRRAPVKARLGVRTLMPRSFRLIAFRHLSITSLCCPLGADTRTAAALGKRFRARATALTARFLELADPPRRGRAATSLGPEAQAGGAGWAPRGPALRPLPFPPRRTTVRKLSAAGGSDAEGGGRTPPIATPSQRTSKT